MQQCTIISPSSAFLPSFPLSSFLLSYLPFFDWPEKHFPSRKLQILWLISVFDYFVCIKGPPSWSRLLTTVRSATHTHIHSPKTLGWNRFLSSSSVYYLHFRDQLNRSLADSCRFAHSDFVGRRKALILPILQVGEGGSLAMCVCVCARAINVFVLTSLHLCAKRSSAFCIFVVFDFCFQFCRSLLCSHFLLLVVVQLLSMR